VPTALELFGAVLLVGSFVVLGVGAARSAPTPALAPTILFAFGLMLLCVGWLISPGVPKAASEAIRSGALASAAVLGLYALWLNDQRRRTEQQRLATERERGRIEQDRLTKELEQLGMERARIVDERFTTAIELLGHDSDRVRIGALILLDGLTRTRPALIPDVLDQVCGYLRGPVAPPGSLESEQERRVRQRAQRVLTAVLRRATESVAEIDLTGAALHEFRLDGGTVEVLRLDDARLTGLTTLRGTTVGELVLKRTTTTDDVVIEGGRVDQLVVSGKETSVDGRLICRCDLGSVDIESVRFKDSVELADLTVTGRFAAHADFHRLTLTRVTFAPRYTADDTSIDLFQCTFAGLMSFDEVEVHGATRLAGVRFADGLELGTAEFHHLVTAEEALVAVHSEAHLPAGWRLEDHNAAYRRLAVNR
jgi:hypothetical protein